MRILVSPHRGFTLLELLFVIIIIAILATISSVSFRKTFNSLQLNNSALELQSFINYLSQRAVVERKNIYLNIDDEKGEYWAMVKNEEKRIRTFTIPAGIKIETETKQIIFYPDGTIDSVIIKLINPKGQCISLTTEGVFGGVKIQYQ